MIVKMYATYDKVAEIYGKPFILNEKVAQRTFNWMAKESKEEDVEDKIIREIGSYNDETAEIIPCIPKTVYNLEDARRIINNG